MHALPPACATKSPPPHARQVVMLHLAAYRPFKHTKQLLRPVPLLNVPFLQGSHIDPLEAPAAELAVPIAHRAHTLEPFAVVYVPAAQELHWVAPCPPAEEPG